MKIILSRKGFDSSAGGCASPIFADGSFLSLPIPQPHPLPAASKRITFSHINFKYPVGKVVEDLTQYRVKANDTIHFDPDLRKESLPRKDQWRALFGQAGGAQTHLAQHGIAPGDIFLFFGWFKEVEKVAGAFRFKRGARDRHVLFGWLEIGEVWKLGMNRVGVPAWADMHPHITTEFTDSNTVYVAADKSGSAGAFPKFTDALALTAPGENRSVWRLPKWFHPGARTSCLSYHADAARWKQEGDFTYLTSVGRGQEFVLDAVDYPEAEEWARQLIAENL
jgi:putative DNA base modification enzyme with NMAD domain